MTDQTRADAVRAPQEYVIVKRGLFYRPGANGYTGIKDEAGRYSLEECAVYFPNFDSKKQDGMTFMRVEDAPDYSEACFWDVKLRHENEKLRAEVASLRARLASEETPNE